MTDKERTALDACLAYRRAQLAADIHVYGYARPGSQPPLKEGELHDLYVESRKALDEVLRERDGSTPKGER